MNPMKRDRTHTIGILCLVCFAQLALASASDAQETEAPKTSPEATKEASATVGESVSIENLPYLIDLRFSVSDDVALDASSAKQILADADALGQRVVGPAWKVTSHWAEGQVWDTAFDSWTQWPEPLTYDRKEKRDGEKVWLVRARSGAAPGTLELVGREFDRASGIFGPSRRRTTSVADLSRGLIELCLDIFRPVAEVAGFEGGDVRLRVRGSALAAAKGGGVLHPGQSFQLVRLFFERGGKFAASTVEPWTYLKIVKTDESEASASLISSFRDPIGRRYRQTNKLIAMALTPADLPTTFQFSQLVVAGGATPVRHPVAGYKAEIHEWPDGPVRATALTDRDGRLQVSPPEGLDFFGVRLVGGALEPLLDVPVLAGDQVPAILADTKPAAVEFQQRLIAYRDDILDSLARRFVIEARLADRTKASDWPRVSELIREWRNTPIPTGFSSTLAQWKQTAQRRQIQERKAIYTQANQALMAELEALASRYEGQEIDVFEESLEKRSNQPYLQDLADQDKEKAKKSD